MNVDVFCCLVSYVLQCQFVDLVLVFIMLWLGCLCNWMDYVVGFIFMCWMGLVVLILIGLVFNVLFLVVYIDVWEMLVDLVMCFVVQLKKMCCYQCYDVEQIVCDSGKVVGDELLFGLVLNVKVFDYQLDIDGVQVVIYIFVIGLVNDFELVLFLDEIGGLLLEIFVNKVWYDEVEFCCYMV